MLLFIAVCAVILHAHGAFIQIPNESIANARFNVPSPNGRLDTAGPETARQHFRSVYTIVRGCLLTIFACVWKSSHPNINGPRDSGWTCMKRKIVLMLCTVTAPELVLYWAMCQRAAAMDIAEQYNREFAIFEPEHKSFWKVIVGWFQTRPYDSTRRGDGQPCTTTHGFFIQMGGFTLYENDYPKEVLGYRRFADLLRRNAIDQPRVTERDLQDHSKGDNISKGIVVLQTSWFVFQCGARAVQRLPLSELEVLTLAFAVVNAAIYIAWWHKPQGVGVATCVPMGSAEKDLQDDSKLLLQVPPPHTAQKTSWLRRMLEKDRSRQTLPVFLLIFLPYRIFFSILRTPKKIAFHTIELNKVEAKQLWVPMFHVAALGCLRTIVASCIIGTIFGATHLIMWASPFPSHREQVLWRVSAIVLSATPVVVFLGSLAEIQGLKRTFDLCVYLMVFVAPCYIAARVVVIVVAFLAIAHPPQKVLLDASWTSNIPHF